MVKLRWYYDKDKEEAWLNEMCREGWAMKSFCLGFYQFEPCGPGEYIYQIDLFTENKNRMTHQEYLELIQETGAEYVCRWFWYRIFRRRSELGEFELYTDNDSKIEQYERFCRFFRRIGILELCILGYDTFYWLIFGRWIGDIGTVFFPAYGLLVLVAAVIWRVYFKMKHKIRDLKQEF